jgi:hypothetical protein
VAPRRRRGRQLDDDVLKTSCGRQRLDDDGRRWLDDDGRRQLDGVANRYGQWRLDDYDGDTKQQYIYQRVN